MTLKDLLQRPRITWTPPPAEGGALESGVPAAPAAPAVVVQEDPAAPMAELRAEIDALEGLTADLEREAGASLDLPAEGDEPAIAYQEVLSALRSLRSRASVAEVRLLESWEGRQADRGNTRAQFLVDLQTLGDDLRDLAEFYQGLLPDAPASFGTPRPRPAKPAPDPDSTSDPDSMSTPDPTREEVRRTVQQVARRSRGLRSRVEEALREDLETFDAAVLRNLLGGLSEGSEARAVRQACRALAETLTLLKTAIQIHRVGAVLGWKALGRQLRQRLHALLVTQALRGAWVTLDALDRRLVDPLVEPLARFSGLSALREIADYALEGLVSLRSRGEAILYDLAEGTARKLSLFDQRIASVELSERGRRYLEVLNALIEGLEHGAATGQLPEPWVRGILDRPRSRKPLPVRVDPLP